MVYRLKHSGGMKKLIYPPFIVLNLLLLFGGRGNVVWAQNQNGPKTTSDFWQHVQFGGAVGLSVGSGYTDITLAPGAIYNFNQYFAAGVGLQGSYIRVKNNYESYLYGGSVIGLFSPIAQLQLSLELEQLRVNTSFSNFYNPNPDIPYPDDNFWNTGLFVGAGYRVQNVAIGVRYNLLYNSSRSVYSDPFMPFIRAYF